MAITVKHSKVSTIPDGDDSSVVRPSDWNDDHVLTGTIPVENGGTGQTTANAAFNALAPSQTGNTGKYLTTDGTNSSWSVNPLGTVTSVAATAGTGISVTGSPITTSGTLNITNTAPDQTVVLTAGTGISTSGTYPNFTITNTSPSLGGDVVGPASATDNAIVRFDTTTGKLIQNSVVTVSDTGAIAGATTITDIDYIDFDTTYSATIGAGQLGWNGNDTLSLGMIGGNVIQHIGEDLYFYCKATATITKGQVVMFTGAVGASGVPTGAPATGITDGTYIMGIAAENIANNGFGLVQAFGELRNINTSGYADGDILWYNPAVAGGLTKIKPVAPNLKAQMAAVINGGSAGGGTILIRINAGSTLGGTDSNAQIDTPSNGQIITYDGQDGYWKNTDLTAGTAISVAESVTGVLTINNTGVTSAVAGTGISVSGATGAVTVTNTAPDQTVVLTAGTGISTSGTYPNFTITNTAPSLGGTVTSVGGTGTVSGISLSGTVTSSGNLTLGGTLNLSSPPAIGGTTPAAGNFTTLGATGVATFSAGTVSAPAITTTGDTNTGMYFPAADTIAFSEGGVESMRIDSAGDVGIGITDPTAKLDVYREARVSFATNDQYRMRLTNSDGNGRILVDGDASALIFGTSAAGTGATATERMRITSTGNVGIGDTNPAYKLTVADTGVDHQLWVRNTGTAASDDAIILVQTSSTGTTSTISGLYFGDGDSSSIGQLRYNHSNDSMVFYTNSAIAFTLSSTGGVSIVRTAVTSPAAGDGNVFSGTYTPSLTNTTNIAASTASLCQYMRVGDVVTVSGTVAIDPTATGRIVMGMSLPIASNFSGAANCGGTFVGSAVTTDNAGAVIADATNDRATFDGVVADAANRTYGFSFTYRVI
jgi:hypothetical protein